MAVPNTFAGATSAIPLSQLDTNFATPITLGNTSIQLGNTVTTLNNMTFANVTITSVATVLPTTIGGTGQNTYSDGQLLIGNTASNTLTKSTLTAGSGITITNGSGSITIAATGGGGGGTSTGGNVYLANNFGGF